MKIATLRYEDFNLGNDVQSLAAERLLPRVDARINYDRLSEARDLGPVALLCNGYFGSHRTPEWPLTENVEALFVGFHASDARIVAGAKGRTRQPIGCRDNHTLELCRQAGLRAYHSGCLTLTLDWPDPRRGEQIVAVDVPREAQARLPGGFLQDAVRLTHHVENAEWSARRRLVLESLATYASARWVITSRLHVVLPCAALGTPVVLIRPDGPDAARRFIGYEHLAWSIHDAPWDTPAPRVPAEYVRRIADPARLAIREFLAALGEMA
jgi:hypothetical protein